MKPTTSEKHPPRATKTLTNMYFPITISLRSNGKLFTIVSLLFFPHNSLRVLCQEQVQTC